jgi:acetyl-CoA acetyltransferase
VRVPTVSTAARSDVPHTSEVVGAVRRACAMAGVGPQDIDLVELADNTAWHVLAWPEFFGFFEPGQSDWMLRHGEMDIDGRLPVNPSGGFLSFGEATTAQGVLQVCELAWQLRGQAGRRQVQGAKLALSAVLGLGANGASVVLKA